MAATVNIRVGIGGWSYDPWRETFYPEEVAKKDELDYASRQLTAIEINSTFYRLQKPHVFAKWRDATPDDFVFSLKSPRFIAQRKVMADAGPFLQRFIESGVTELGKKLGPIVWQLDDKQQFNAADLEAFLKLLPPEANGLQLRHVLDVRHESFRSAAFAELAAKYRTAIVYADDESYPGIAEVTTDFVYARLRRCVSSEPTGYAAQGIAEWAERAKTWASGDQPADLPRAATGSPKATPRDVFIYFINGAKERAPAAAKALIAKLG
jgi:uncharacterized protein YecE (DUF72 family)